VKLDPSAFVADQELIQALEEVSMSFSCNEDRVLFRHGDAPEGLYILNKGEATLITASSADGEVMAVRASSGTLLGLPGLAHKEPYTLTAVARDGAELSFVALSDFMDLIETNPRLLMLYVLASEVRSMRMRALGSDAKDAFPCGPTETASFKWSFAPEDFRHLPSRPPTN